MNVGIHPPRNGLSLCAGAGGLDMGLMLAEPGFHTRCFVEYEDYPQRSIIAAQRAGYFAPAPIWTDLTTFDAKPLAGAIDTLIAGYPCQPFSMAGQRKGADDPRHLWPHVARVARELGDGLRWIFLENVSGHVTLGTDAVLRELRDMGFTPAAGIFSAEEVGASHERQRWFCVAYREGRGRGILGDAAQPGRGRHADGGDEPVADTHGGNPSPEWQQRSGQQRFQPEGGSDGGGVVDDADRDGCKRGAQFRAGRPADQEEWRPDAERHDAQLADADSQGSEPGHPRAERARWDEPGGSRLDLADASGPRPQGREQPGSPDQRDRPPAHGSTAQRGGPWLFPPGPGDAAAWADIIATAPDLAPATGLGDCFTRAQHMAQAMAGPEQAQAQPALCRMADGLANRSRALRLLGNGVQPLAAAYAWRTLSAAHGLGPVDMAGTAADDIARAAVAIRRELTHD